MAALAALRSPAMLCLCESDAFAARKAVVSWCHWIFGEVVRKGAGKTKEMPIGTKNRYFSFDHDADFSRVKVQYTSGCLRLLKLAQIQKDPCGCFYTTCHALSPFEAPRVVSDLFKPCQTCILPFPP